MRIEGPIKATFVAEGVTGSGAASADEAAELLKLIQDETWFDRTWLAYSAEYPGDEGLWEVRFRRLMRRRDFDGAVALIEARNFGEENNPLDAMKKAEWLFAAHQAERATQIYENLLALSPNSLEVRLSYARRMHSNGLLVRAHRLLEPIANQLDDENGVELWTSTSSTLTLLTQKEGAELDEDADCRILALKHAILHFRDRTPRPTKVGDLGRLSLITGSVGPGGAERQLTRLAIELERARRTEGLVEGCRLSRPVEIVVRSYRSEQQHDFYLQDVKDAGVEIHQLDAAKPLTHAMLGISDPQLKILLNYLPPSVNYGVRRLTQHLVDGETDVMSAWQDGACLFASLPALLAGVPKIQLSIRGLPPSVRKHMFRPEYELLYRAMAEIPGVTFVSNNRAAANSYADWLRIDRDRFSVVFNGVPPMTSDGPDECVQMLEEFNNRTADADQTIGGVFRIDTDKQPNLWVRFAARYLKKHPRSRFIIVGGGRLLGGARELAEELGIAERILFTDRSNHVGFWMSHMDVLVLLSRYEGLPNVLIEAQHMGVRVVTTPAGGASECILNGVTGYVLECCEKPDLDQIVERAHEWASTHPDPDLFHPGGVGQEFLERNFSIANMLRTYVACTVGNQFEDNVPRIAQQAA